jgi:hypothetical protein
MAQYRNSCVEKLIRECEETSRGQAIKGYLGLYTFNSIFTSTWMKIWNSKRRHQVPIVSQAPRSGHVVNHLLDNNALRLVRTTTGRRNHIPASHCVENRTGMNRGVVEFSDISDSTSSFSSKSGLNRHVRPLQERYIACDHWSVHLVGMIRH